LDFKQYPALKAAGVITLAKHKQAFTATLLRFSSEFGTQVEPVVEAIDIEHLESYATEIQAMKAGLAQLIADLKALPQP